MREASSTASQRTVVGRVFDSIDADSQATVGEAIRGYWTRFAATGDPNGGGAPTWPAFGASDVRVNLDVDVTQLNDFRADACAFWRTLYDADFAPP